LSLSCAKGDPLARSSACVLFEYCTTTTEDTTEEGVLAFGSLFFSVIAVAFEEVKVGLCLKANRVFERREAPYL